MLRWDWYGFDKKPIRTHYAELLFLHPVGSTDHVVHSNVSGAQIVDTLFLILGRDRYRFQKNCAGTHYTEHVFLHTVGYVGHVVQSGASGS
jgi:hypothetical protein